MRFKKVYIEITNICNLECNFCPKTKRELRYMDKDSFSYILKSIKPYTKYIYFHLMGEPLMHPELEAFLTLCYKEGFRVNLTTNGTLLKKAQDILLNAKALRQINISLHSFEANQSSYDCDTYLNQVLEFIKYMTQKSNIICSLRLWNLDSKDKSDKTYLNSHILYQIEKSLQLSYDLERMLKETKQIKLDDHIYLNMASQFEWGTMTKDKYDSKKFCLGLRDQIGILVDGTVVPCCLDNDGNIPLGNIYKESLENIVTSKKAKAIYDGFSRRLAVEELCKRCGYR